MGKQYKNRLLTFLRIDYIAGVYRLVTPAFIMPGITGERRQLYAETK